jgi:hypothetical protein
MVPSIGRIVHFMQGDHVCHPAIITKVWDDNVVNLHVFFDEHPSQIKTGIWSEETTQNSMAWKWPDKI